MRPGINGIPAQHSCLFPGVRFVCLGLLLLFCSCGCNRRSNAGGGTTSPSDGSVLPATILVTDSVGVVGIAPQSDFTVTVNGQSSFVYPVHVDSEAWDKDDSTYETGGLVRFDFIGTVTVTVTVAASRPVFSAKIVPASRGVTPILTGQRITFTLNAAKPCILQLNGSLQTPLHILAYPPETDPVSPSDPQVVTISSGVHPQDYWQNIVDAHPGKTFYFLPGIHRGVSTTPKIILRDGQQAYLPTGAYVECCFRVTGDAVAIRGRGFIDRTNDTVYSPDTVGNLIRLSDATNALIEGVAVLDGWSGWSIQIYRSSTVKVRNVTVISYRLGSDSCNPTGGSSNVTITGCFFRSGDDCISFKCSGLTDNLENVTVSDCLLWQDAGWGPIAFGKSTNAQYIQNIRISDIDIVNSRKAISFNPDGSAQIHNVHLSDIRVENMRGANPANGNLPRLVYVSIEASTPAPTAQIYDIQIDRLALLSYESETPTTTFMGNSPAATVSDIHFSKFTWLGAPVTDISQCNAQTNVYADLSTIIFAP